MRVELRAEARRDLDAGAWFYELQRSGLGNYFIDRVTQDLAALESQAGIHETVYGFHRKLVKRFPFAIYYRVIESRAEVVAILDCRRDPRTTEKRLTETPS